MRNADAETSVVARSTAAADALAVIGVLLGAERDLLADLACALFPPHFDGTQFILNMCGEICAKSTVKQDAGEVHD